MHQVEEIKDAINSLSRKDYILLREWFSEKDWEAWDEQIQADSDSGKLDFLIQEARSEKRRGTLREL